jgi:hypothetical protein
MSIILFEIIDPEVIGSQIHINRPLNEAEEAKLMSIDSDWQEDGDFLHDAKSPYFRAWINAGPNPAIKAYLESLEA